jgi:hypothetical protein
MTMCFDNKMFLDKSIKGKISLEISLHTCNKIKQLMDILASYTLEQSSKK